MTSRCYMLHTTYPYHSTRSSLLALLLRPRETISILRRPPYRLYVCLSVCRCEVRPKSTGAGSDIRAPCRRPAQVSCPVRRRQEHRRVLAATGTAGFVMVPEMLVVATAAGAAVAATVLTVMILVVIVVEMEVILARAMSSETEVVLARAVRTVRLCLRRKTAQWRRRGLVCRLGARHCAAPRMFCRRHRREKARTTSEVGHPQPR